MLRGSALIRHDANVRFWPIAGIWPLGQLKCVFQQPLVGLTSLFTDCSRRVDKADRRLNAVVSAGTERSANLHIRARDRFNQRYPLLCRDYLRAHPDAAAAYAEIKRQLARRFADDADAYYDIKDPVFDVIMAGAREWAERTAWQEPASDA